MTDEAELRGNNGSGAEDGNLIPAEVRDLLLSRLEQASKLDWLDGPFGMPEDQAREWVRGKRDALEWVSTFLSLKTRPVAEVPHADMKQGFRDLLNSRIALGAELLVSPLVVQHPSALPLPPTLYRAHQQGRHETLSWIAEMLNVPA